MGRTEAMATAQAGEPAVEQPGAGAHVDEANVPDPEPARHRSRHLDLEAPREDDLPVAHDPGLERRIAEAEGDHELGGRHGAGGLRGRVVGAALRR